MHDLPNAHDAALDQPSLDKLNAHGISTHPPRILILYGSLRPQSFSRKLALEAKRLLEHFGAEVQVFDPHALPILDSVPPDHPEVSRLRELSLWSEGQVWVGPERHGTVTGVLKNQIDWLPLEEAGVRPTQCRTLAVMQVCGGSQSFNVVNALRVLGRWMRMVTIPNQSSVPKAWQEFDPQGRMKPSPSRPGRRCDGGIGEVHAAGARPQRVSGGSLQRTKGRPGGGGTREGIRSGGHRLTRIGSRATCVLPRPPPEAGTVARHLPGRRRIVDSVESDPLESASGAGGGGYATGNARRQVPNMRKDPCHGERLSPG